MQVLIRDVSHHVLRTCVYESSSLISSEFPPPEMTSVLETNSFQGLIEVKDGSNRLQTQEALSLLYATTTSTVTQHYNCMFSHRLPLLFNESIRISEFITREIRG